MENYIKNIQDTVMKYAEILSEVLKVDVEILDNQFRRIAGTGKFKNYINCDMSREAHIYKRVIDSEEKNVNWNPGEQEICERGYSFYIGRFYDFLPI